MTVNELIAALQEIENKDQPVQIQVRQYNKASPVAYLDLKQGLGQVWGNVRITAWLPETDTDFMITATRKK